MFAPDGEEMGRRGLRIAFANLGREGIGALLQRLAAVTG
jgi:hypothetical protein